MRYKRVIPLFAKEDIEVFKKNYYRKKTGENEQ